MLCILILAENCIMWCHSVDDTDLEFPLKWLYTQAR